jgi:hypothetical protein
MDVVRRGAAVLTALLELVQPVGSIDDPYVMGIYEAIGLNCRVRLERLRRPGFRLIRMRSNRVPLAQLEALSNEIATPL